MNSFIFVGMCGGKKLPRKLNHLPLINSIAISKCSRDATARPQTAHQFLAAARNPSGGVSIPPEPIRFNGICLLACAFVKPDPAGGTDRSIDCGAPRPTLPLAYIRGFSWQAPTRFYNKTRGLNPSFSKSRSSLTAFICKSRFGGSICLRYHILYITNGLSPLCLL